MEFQCLARMNAGLVRIATDEYGAQLWTRGKARKAKKCELCQQPTPVGAITWKPLTNGYNRMHRLCDTCVSGLAREAERAD